MERYEIPNEVPFPLRLHIVLSQVETLEQSHIVSWMPSGKSFRVHNREEFERLVLPEYFRSSNFRSFQRNLSVYQFNRIWSGPEKGAYFHEKFVRHDRTLCTLMKRNATPRTTKKDQNTDERFEIKAGKIIDDHIGHEGDCKPAAHHESGQQDEKQNWGGTRQPGIGITSITCPVERTQSSHQRLDFKPPDQQESYRSLLIHESDGRRPCQELFGMTATAQPQAVLPTKADNQDDDDDPLLLDRLWAQTLDAFVASKNPSFTIRPTMFNEGGSSNFGSESEVSGSSSNRQLVTTQSPCENMFAPGQPNLSIEINEAGQTQRSFPLDPSARIVFLESHLQDPRAMPVANMHSRGWGTESSEPRQRLGREPYPSNSMGSDDRQVANSSRSDSPLAFPNNSTDFWWSGTPS